MEIKVEYYIDKDEMSEQEYDNQDPKIFVITEDMIKELIENKSKEINLAKGDYVSDLYIIRS